MLTHTFFFLLDLDLDLFLIEDIFFYWVQAAAAAESFNNIQEDAEEEPSKGANDAEDSVKEGEDGHEKEKLMSALDKLENASEDTFLSQASHFIG